MGQPPIGGVSTEEAREGFVVGCQVGSLKAESFQDRQALSGSADKNHVTLPGLLVSSRGSGGHSSEPSTGSGPLFTNRHGEKGKLAALFQPILHEPTVRSAPSRMGILRKRCCFLASLPCLLPPCRCVSVSCVGCVVFGVLFPRAESLCLCGTEVRKAQFRCPMPGILSGFTEVSGLLLLDPRREGADSLLAGKAHLWRDNRGHGSNQCEERKQSHAKVSIINQWFIEQEELNQR